MSVTVSSAKKQFCSLVSLAEAGKETVIKRRSAPVAKVVPFQRDSARLTAEWRERRKKIRLNRKGQSRLSVSDLVQEGRK